MSKRQVAHRCCKCHTLQLVRGHHVLALMLLLTTLNAVPYTHEGCVGNYNGNITHEFDLYGDGSVFSLPLTFTNAVQRGCWQVQIDSDDLTNNSLYSFKINGNQYYWTINGTKTYWKSVGGLAAGNGTGGNGTINNFYGSSSVGVSSGVSPLYDASTMEIDGYLGSPWMTVGHYQNFLLQTEVMGTTWTRVNISTAVGANNARNPRDELTAEWIAPGTTAGANLYQNVTNATLGNWTFSIYLKSNSGNLPINISVGQFSGGDETKQEINLTSRWKRYSVTHDFQSAHTVKTVRIINGMNNVSAWGAQLEPSWAARPYSGARTTSALTAITSTTQVASALQIAGAFSGATSGSFSSTVTSSVASTTNAPNFATAGVAITGSSAATSATPLRSSPPLRFSANIWNGTASKANQMYMSLIGGVVNATNTTPILTIGRGTIDGAVSNNASLFNFTHTGDLSVSNNLTVRNTASIGNCALIGEDNKTRLGHINTSGFTYFEADGTMEANGEATTYNIVQKNLYAELIPVEGGDTPVPNEKDGTVVFEDEKNQFMVVTFRAPRDMEPLTSVTARFTYWTDEGGYFPDMRLYFRRLKTCDRIPEWTDGGFGEDKCEDSRADIIQERYWSSIGDLLDFDDIFQFKLIRDSGDDLNGTVQGLTLEMIYEQNTLGSRELMSK